MGLYLIVNALIILLLLIIVFQIKGLKPAQVKEPAHRKFEILANLLSVAAFDNKGTIQWTDHVSFELYDGTNPYVVNIIHFRYKNDTLNITWKVDPSGANPVVLQKEYHSLTDTSWSQQEKIAKELTEAMGKLKSL